MKRNVCFIFVVICLASVLLPFCVHADSSRIDAEIGPDDSVLLISNTGACVYEKNADKPLIPASTFKVLTALSAFQYLGQNFRFKTEFYMDRKNNLTIKGYGDPLLVSEVISICCDMLYPIIIKKTGWVNDIRFDDSYFKPITVPGVSNGSPEPYDSPNGALCANFNTVSFYTDKDGILRSGEAQTPLLPFVIDRIRSSGLKKGRILLNQTESRVYAASLFRHFLVQKGLDVKGRVKSGNAGMNDQTLIYTFTSPYSLSEIVRKLLEFSNNFIANQLFLTLGVTQYGPPGTLDKGVESMKRFISSRLNPDEVIIREGSGISRLNRISARNMDRILKEFMPYRHLMKATPHHVLYKTGTLKGISTRVGYIEKTDHQIYRFVVFMNSQGKSSEKITRMLLKIVSSESGS